MALRTCLKDVAAVRAEPRDTAERVTELPRGEAASGIDVAEADVRPVDPDGVLEEPEPERLRSARRGFVRFETGPQTETELTTDTKTRL